jgi:hypothetical protein
MVPVNEALQLLNAGMKEGEVSQTLEGQGYNLHDISDAINQAKIKQGVEGNMPPQEQQMQESIDQSIPMPEEQNYPQMQQYQMPAQPSMSYEQMQAIVEQIVEEKWKDMARNVGDINIFKARVGDDMESVKQELLRTQKRLEDLQVAVLGKVKDYNESVINISNDMKALEQVFSKILTPLTQNVKDLSKITEELKKK